MIEPVRTHASMPDSRFSIRSWGDIDDTLPSHDWIPVFLNWRDIQKRYLAEIREPPWWYSERPQVGFLATAIHLAGGVALQEYSSRQLSEDNESTARIDVWAMLRKRGYLIEAKFFTPRLSDLLTRSTFCESEKDGKAQLLRYAKHEENKRFMDAAIFVSFVAPWVPRNPKGKCDDDIARFRSCEFRGVSSCGYRIDFYPEYSIDEEVKKEIKDPTKYSPGITLFIEAPQSKQGNC